MMRTAATDARDPRGAPAPTPSGTDARVSARPPARRVGVIARAAVAGVAILLLTSCEEGGPLAPDTGNVEVTVSGAPIPQGGMTVTLDGNRTRTVTAQNNPVTFDNVPSGQRQIALSGFAPGCSALDNPRVRNLQAGGIVRTTFIVSC